MVFRSSLRRLEAAPIYSFEVMDQNAGRLDRHLMGRTQWPSMFEYMSCSFRHLRAALRASFSYYESLLAAFEQPTWHDSNRFKRAI